MTAIEKYLDLCRPLAARPSDYGLAELLDVSAAAINHWRTGKRTPEPIALKRIAELLDQPIEKVMAEVYAEGEADAEKAREWKDLARKFAACVVMGSAITTAPSEGRSAIAPGLRFTAHSDACDVDLTTLQIMRRLRGFLHRVWHGIKGRGLALAPRAL